MIAGIGTDIVEISRIRKAIESQGAALLNRLFSQEEQAYCQRFSDPYPRYAARFAAKEAVAKAFGCGIGKELSFRDIEITLDAAGKPSAHAKGTTLHLSLSHSEEYATAFAILER